MTKERAAKGRARHFIKEWRRHRGLTQQVLAERVGLTHAAISQLETGRAHYTQPTLEALAVALGCAAGDLLARDPSSPEHIQAFFERVPRAAQPLARAILEALIATPFPQAGGSVNLRHHQISEPPDL